jgi:hypothetical protein
MSEAFALIDAQHARSLTDQMRALTEATKAQAAATLAAALINTRGAIEDGDAFAIYHMVYGSLFDAG